MDKPENLTRLAELGHVAAVRQVVDEHFRAASIRLLILSSWQLVCDARIDRAGVVNGRIESLELWNATLVVDFGHVRRNLERHRAYLLQRYPVWVIAQDTLRFFLSGWPVLQCWSSDHVVIRFHKCPRR